MTYDEAAKWFEDYPPLAIWDEEDGGYDEVPHEAIHLAANTLRAVRDAQSDARKGFEQAFEHWMDNPPPHFHDMEVAVVALQEQNNWAPLKRVCFRDGFDAGHAQGFAAGLAASPSDVSEHLQEMWRKSVCFLRDQLEAKKRALAAQEAKRKELDAQLEASQANAAYRLRSMDILEAALATAKAECEQLKDHCLDAIKVQNEAQADALELANEVRRCWTEMEASLATICEMHMLGKAHEIEMLCKDRPAAVTAAMERYK